jgi:hypothetical protein
VSLYAVSFADMLGATGVRAWKGYIYKPSQLHWFVTSTLLVILMSTLTCLCISAAKAEVLGNAL